MEDFERSEVNGTDMWLSKYKAEVYQAKLHCHKINKTMLLPNDGDQYQVIMFMLRHILLV